MTADVGAPELEDRPALRDGDVPVSWACGVTPHAAIMASRPPGHMLVPDVPDAAYAA